MKLKLNLTAIAQRVACGLEAIGVYEPTRQFYQTWVIASLIAILELMVRLRPQQAGNHYHLATALLKQGQWEAAQVAIKQAIALNPSLAAHHQALAAAYRGQGLWAEAIQASQRSIELQPNCAWYYHDLGKAYTEQEAWLEAIPAFQQAIELAPNIFWFHFNLGEAFLKSGRWAEAAKTLEQAIEQEPSFVWSYYYLGEALLAQEKIDDAIALYEQALRIRPSNDQLRCTLAYALQLQDQWQKISDYRQRLAAAPADGRLKILMLTPYPPFPPKLGALSRMFHEVKCLGERHHLVVASFIFSKEDYQLEFQLEQHCDLAITMHLGDAKTRQPEQPKLIHRYSSQRMEKVLKELGAIDFDIVSFNFIYMAQYRHFFPRAYHVLEEHNIESDLLKRCAELNRGNTTINKLAQQVDAVRAFMEADREAQLLAAYEDAEWPHFPLRHVVSENDREILDSRCSVGETLIVNNGIDLHSVTLLPDNPNRQVLFIGTLSYYPNIDGACYFADTILPLIWQKDPTVKFWIAGASPPTQVKDLAKDARIKVIADPDDMSEVAKACSITVVPLRVGSGTRIKIIHSMAMGLPVVSTSLGCEGLKVEDGKHLLVRDRPEAFAEAVLQLLQDIALRQSLRHTGRQLVEQEYDWQSIYAQAEQGMVKRFQQWQAQQQVQVSIK